MLFLTGCTGQQPATPVQDINFYLTAGAATNVMGQTLTAAAATPTFTPEPPTATQQATATFAQPTLDPNATATATFQQETVPTATVFAESMPTATIIVNSNTPIPTPTPFSLSTPNSEYCDNSEFIADITVSDGTVMKPGETFQKIWRVKNTGTCRWDEGYWLGYVYGDTNLSGLPYYIKTKEDFIDPGEIVDLGLWLTAPTKKGTYSSCWRMINDREVQFGTAMCVVIKVGK
jgi:hypothetical protein